MSTRSNIGIKRKNGNVEVIYCHWDGYLSYNGAILLEHYNDINKINELIDLGDISVLNENVSPKEGEKHTFGEPQRGVVVAYGRDRGETNIDKKVYKTIDKFFDSLADSWVEYIYIFNEEENKWYYTTIDSRNLMELTKKETEKESE